MAPTNSLAAWASWFIFGGGFLVLIGSFRQAKGELGEYWHTLSEKEKEQIAGRPRGIVRRVLGAGDSSAAMQGLMAFMAGWLALARVELGSEEGKKALRSATAWSLILVGSAVASLAAAYQAVALTFPRL